MKYKRIPITGISNTTSTHERVLIGDLFSKIIINDRNTAVSRYTNDTARKTGFDDILEKGPIRSPNYIKIKNSPVITGEFLYLAD